MTTGPFDDREPHWSPDGKSIAFSSDRSGNYDVWILEIASSRLRQITTNPANDYFPTWSPDGREIAFVSSRTPSPGVYAAELDGARTSGPGRLRQRRRTSMDARRHTGSVQRPAGRRIQPHRPDESDARHPVHRVGRRLLSIPRTVVVGRRIPLHRRRQDQAALARARPRHAGGILRDAADHTGELRTPQARLRFDRPAAGQGNRPPGPLARRQAPGVCRAGRYLDDAHRARRWDAWYE